MNRLIILAGASGAGKSFLLEQLYERDENIEPVKKLSTRKKRDYEKEQRRFVDLIFGVSRELINQCEYHYKYEANHYGIQKDDLDYMLDRGKSPIIIVRNSKTVEKLKQDYPRSLIIYVQNILSGSDLKDKLIELGRSDINIEQRMTRFVNDFYDYCNNAHLYDYVILNKFERNTFLSQFENILTREYSKPQFSKTICFISGNTYESKYIKVDRFLKNSIYRHYSLIKLNEFKSGPIISPSIENRLLRTDFVILDMDGDNGNLQYYQGFLKAKGKDFISLYPSGQESFKQGSSDSIVYNGDDDYLAIIDEKVSEYLKLPKSRHTKLLPMINHLMNETIKEAAKTTFEDDTKPRPFVGAILVDPNLTEIVRAHRGGDNGNGEHAEYRLLEKLKHKNIEDLKNCTLFVSLEPCTTRNNPKIPCFKRVIDSGIGRLFIGMLDPDIRIRGNGVIKLKEAGIKVDMFPNEIEEKLRELNSEWIQWIKEKDYKDE